MKFIVSSTLLLKQLLSVNGIINSNNTLPILDNFLFELKNDELQITTSDLETTMVTKMNVTMAEGDGCIAVPAKIMIDTLKTLTDIPVSFLVNTNTKDIDITAGEGRFQIKGYNGEEFPKLPVIENSNKIEINGGILNQAITKTMFAAGTDDLRPVMSGVLFEFGNDLTTFVATDAHKLVRYKRKDVKSDEAVSFIMPRKPLNQLKNLLTKETSNVIIEYNQVNSKFEFDNIIIICRLIDGKYPNYEAVIPNDNPNKLIIDRHLFLNSIRRISNFSSQATHQIRLKITGLELVLTAEDPDFANAGKERLSCNYTGEDIEIGFNSKFLIDILSNLDNDEVSFELSTPMRAGLILPVNNENKDEDILMLVMPVMLNN